MKEKSDDDDVEEDETLSNLDIKKEPKDFVPPLAEAFSKYGLCQKVLEKTIPPAENVLELLKLQGHKDLDNLYKELQYDAFSCFNNLVQELPIEDVGGEGEVKIASQHFPFL